VGELVERLEALDRAREGAGLSDDAGRRLRRQVLGEHGDADIAARARQRWDDLPEHAPGHARGDLDTDLYRADDIDDTLGSSPEVDGTVHARTRGGAGMARNPRHHVFPQEHRTWFEAHGFVGEYDIDHYTIRMRQADHEAIHGGGNWRLARDVKWEHEWNRRVMWALEKRKADAMALTGRPLTREEVMDRVFEMMDEYSIERDFVHYKAKLDDE
jgi:hypothetical protein